MKSRSAGKDDWSENDEIGVQIGKAGKIGRYMLYAEGSVKRFINTIHWLNSDPATVYAWYPYEPVVDLSIADQSVPKAEIDFLTASAEGQTFESMVNLTFNHQMAKVSCKLLQGDGISDEEWATVKVSYAGYTRVSFDRYSVSGAQHGWITPDKNYEALLVPQDMSGRDFIKIDITVNVNGKIMPKTFIYKSADGNLMGGVHYSYTVKVSQDRIEVAPITASWNDSGTPQPADPAPFYVSLINVPEEQINEMSFSSNVTPMYGVNPGNGENGYYLFVKGNRFSISYDVTDANMLKGFNIINGGEYDSVVREIDEGQYIFNYYM